MTAGYLRHRPEPGLAANVMNPAHPDDANPDGPPPHGPGAYGRRVTSYRQPGTVLTDHTFRVPLDYDRPDGEHIEVFAREVVAADKADADLPWLLFLQGGPGFGSPRPVGRDSWLTRALDDYRVLLLDQRGTGRSTPANRHTLARLGSPAAQADYLALSAADNIVRDAELIRRRAHRRCAVERAGAELRRLLHGHLPVAGPGGHPRGADHRRTARAGRDRRRRVPGRLSPGRAKNAEHYERYPVDVERGAPDRPPPSGGRRPAARRRAADRGELPVARPDARLEPRQRHAALPARGRRSTAASCPTRSCARPSRT